MLRVKITPYLDVIKKEIRETHELNQKNYGINADKIMEDMADEAAIHKVYANKPSKHMTELTNFFKKLDNI